MSWVPSVRYLLGLACVLALGCGGVNPTASNQPSPQNYGGTLHVGFVHLWDDLLLTDAAGIKFDTTLDPQTPFEQAEIFRCCLLRTLLSYNGRPSSEGGTKLRPDLATAFPDVSEDGLTWTFHLRSGVHYGPPMGGTEIVAPDIVRAVERDLTPTPPEILARFPSVEPYLGNAWPAFVNLVVGAQAFADGTASSIAGLEAPDPHTLRVHTVKRSGDLPYLFALANTAPLPVNPAAPLDRLGIAQGHDMTRGPFLVSSGPYMLEGADRLDFSRPADQQQPAAGYQSGIGFTLVRNPSWSMAQDSLRPAYVDRIEFTTLVSDVAATAAIEGGTIDVAWDATLPRADVERYSSDSTLRGQLQEAPNDVVLIVFMNLATRPFDDIHVRRALNIALDKGRIHDLAASLQAGLAGPTGGTIATHLVVDGLEDDLLTGYRPYDAPDDHGNIAAARAELALSVYDTNGDGMCDAPACGPLRTLVRDSEPFWQQAAQVIAVTAAELGITLDLQSVSTREMFRSALDPEARLPLAIGLRYIKDYPTAAGVLPSLFESGAAVRPTMIGSTPEELRSWGYDVASVPNVDDRVERCQSNLREPPECWARLDQYLMGEVAPALPLIFGESSWIVSTRLSETSFSQAFTEPALDQFVIDPAAR